MSAVKVSKINEALGKIDPLIAFVSIEWTDDLSSAFKTRQGIFQGEMQMHAPFCEIDPAPIAETSVGVGSFRAQPQRIFQGHFPTAVGLGPMSRHPSYYIARSM